MSDKLEDGGNTMTFEEIQSVRESCRIYQDRPVEREKLEKLAEIGHMAPSACNSQPWRYLIIDEPEAKEKLQDAFDDEGINSCKWGAGVPAFLVICEDHAILKPGVSTRYDSQHFAQIDIGLTAMTICFEALDLGLSTCMVGIVNQKKMQQHFGIPEDRVVRLVIAIGYAPEETKIRPKTRKTLDQVMSFNRW